MFAALDGILSLCIWDDVCVWKLLLWRMLAADALLWLQHCAELDITFHNVEMHLQFDGLWILWHADGCFLHVSLTDLLLAIISLHVWRHHIVQYGYDNYHLYFCFALYKLLLLNHFFAFFIGDDSFLLHKLRESYPRVFHQFVPNCSNLNLKHLDIAWSLENGWDPSPHHIIHFRLEQGTIITSNRIQFISPLYNTSIVLLQWSALLSLFWPRPPTEHRHLQQHHQWYTIAKVIQDIRRN